MSGLLVRVITKLLPKAYCDLPSFEEFEKFLEAKGAEQAFTEFSRVLADRPQLRMEELRAQLEKEGKNLSDARGTIIKLLRLIPELERERTILETQGITAEHVKKEWDMLIGMPCVKGVTVDPGYNSLVINLEPTVLDCETDITKGYGGWYRQRTRGGKKNSRYVLLGTYQIKYNYVSHELRIYRQPDDPVTGLSTHPHIRGSGACFGTAEMMIQAALAEYRITDVTALIWDYLGCCDASDGWGCDIARWEPYAWEETPKGKVVWGTKPEIVC